MVANRVTSTSTATIAILAGCQSRRMKTDKSFVMLHDKPVLERVRTLQLPIILITNAAEKYAPYELAMYPDLLPDQGL